MSGQNGSVEQNTKSLLNSLTSYDIFGYFIPPLIFISSILFFDFLIRRNFIINFINNKWDIPSSKVYPNLVNILSGLIKNRTDSNQLVFYLIFFVLSLSALYVLGHFIATLSSFIIDKIFIGKCLGFPYFHILFESNDIKKIFKELYPENEIKILLIFITFFNGYFLLCTFIKIKILFITKFLIFAGFTLLLLILKISNDFMKKYMEKFKLLKLLYSVINNSNYLIFMCIISFLRMFRIYNPFPKELSKRINNELRKYYGELNLGNDKNISQALNTENYWLTYIYLKSSNLSFMPSISHFVNLYGFSRNICMSFILVGVFFTLSYYLFGFYHKPFIRFVDLLCYFMALCFFMRYLYLFSTYYTKLIFRFFLLQRCYEGKRERV